MRKLIKTGIMVLVIGLTIILIISIAGKEQKSRLAMEKIKSLPVFSFRTLTDSAFRSDQLKSGPLLILFFHPECEHCRYQVAALLDNVPVKSGLQILLISNAERELIRKFFTENNLFKYPGLTALVDETYSFKEYFGTDLIPSLFIYDRKLKLIRYFQGEVRPETVLKYMRYDDQ